MTATTVGARRDLLHVSGSGSLEIVLKKRGVESFAVACRLGGRFLVPSEMAFDKALFSRDHGFDLMVPSWQASPGPGLADVAAAVYSSSP